MKSRIKKLLAAALALCLIAALVPGAALAAGTTVATVNQNGTDKPFATLEEALSAASSASNDENRTVTLTSDYTLSANASVGSGVTLIINSGATLTVSDNVTFTNNGTLENRGSIAVAGTFTSNGKLTNDSNIEVVGGTAPDDGGTITISGNYSGNGGIEVGARGKANLANNQKVGSLTVYGTVASSAITVTGTATIYPSGTLDVDSLTIQGTATNNGTIDSTTITVYQGSNFTHNASSTSSLTGSVEVYGKLDISGGNEYRQNIEIEIHDGGEMSASGNYSIVSNGELTVSGDLNITGGTFDAGNHLTVSNGEVNISGNAEVDVDNIPSGKISVNNATLKVKGAEMIGPHSLDGDAVITDGGKTITVDSGTVKGPRGANNAYTVGSGEKLVVENLTVSYPLTIDGELVVNDEVNSNAAFTISNNGKMSGSGSINTNGPLYNLNNQAADELSIYIGQGGGVYATNNAIDINVKGGQPTTNPAPNTTVYAYAKVYSQGITYTIMPSFGSNGTADVPPSALEQTEVTFIAEPDEGYMVDPATTYYRVGNGDPIDIAVNGTKCSFVMPSNNVTVHVGFKKAENSSTTTEGNITVVTNHNGNGTVNASINGRVVTVTVRANTNYVINTVSIAGKGQTVATDAKSGTYSYTVPGTGNATVEVYVTFKSDDFEVTLTNYTYDDGRISLSTGTTTTGRYAEGDQVTIYAFPDRDFYVRSLTITRTDNRQTVSYSESSTSDDVFYFTMPASNVTVRAYFTDGVYEIATDIDGSGRLTITGEDGNVTDVAEEGEEIRITASPSNNYRLGDIYVNYTDADDEDQVIYPEVEYKNNGNVDYYWFEMPEYDVEIYADFGEGDYVAWIDRSDMENGTIRVSPNVADEDDTVSIYVTPDTGYQLDELIVEDEDGHDVTTTSLASGTRYTFRMPDSDVTVTATFKSRSYSSNFTDVPRYEWYYEAVSYVASEGLMNGVSTTQFNPNGTASRAQIVTILWRLAGEPSALTGAFTDVPAGQYYSTAVAWASRQGIVTGVGNNRFEPNSNITREQLAVILYRYAQDAGYTTSASANITGYYDYARVNSYARTAMSWAVGAGLITGTSTTTLSPQDTATRAQVATILMRFCENIAK